MSAADHPEGGGEPVADVRVAVVEDHPIFRDGLCRLVDSSDGLQLRGSAGCLEDLTVDLSACDVVLLDLHLPGRSGTDAVGFVRRQGPAVLVVSAAGARDDVLDAVAAGAGGYLTKDAEPAEVLLAIGKVAAGGSHVSPTLASYLLASEDDLGAERLDLTEREKEVLALVAQGERDKDIAEQLFISVRTVRSHLDRIRDKTGRRRRPDLTRLAIEQGVTRRPQPPV